MPDTTSNDNIILASYMLACKRSHVDNADFELDVLKTAARLRPYVSDKAAVSRMLESIPIYATVESVAFEKTSNRYVVTFVADNQPNGKQKVETIRSDRTDSRHGKLVERMFSDIAGKHVCLYKYLEQTSNRDMPEVRVCPFVQVLDY